MVKAISWLIMLSLLAGLTAFAQAPTGIIVGTVTDESGAVIPNASVIITNKATSSARPVTANAEGLFSAPALPAGVYEVRAEVTGFKTTIREATVEVGTTTTVNLALQLGGTKDVVNVEAATAQINYESNAIQGVIERNTIQELPLNGRSFMQLASLEPGVTIAAGTTAQFNTLFTVSVLGGGNRTVFTVDGGNISDNIDTGGGISSMNFSQEVVQEFQLSSVNFDLSTPIAAGGAINIVTRSGSNDFHGSGYFFYRDHNIAAYPNLVRDPGDPSPFFARRQPGAWIGGPIKKDKLFFFFNYEHTNQVQAVSINGGTGAFAPLTNTYGSPYTQRELSFKLDYRLSAKNSLFVRYSHDGNEGFAQSLEFGDPSNWPHNNNWADQSILGFTSVLTPALVNDFRFQYNYWSNKNEQATAADCSLPCVAGSGLPNVFYFQGAANVPAIGPNFNAPQGRNTRRFELVDSLSWQKGNHRFKFGGDLNPTYSAGLWGFCTPLCTAAFSPDYIRSLFGAATPLYFPTLPTQLTSDAQVLNLPVLSLASSIFSGVGVGNISTPGAYNYDQNKAYDQYRAFFQDTWKILPNLTFNYGVAWNAQTGFYNVGIPKPQFLAPILGTGSNLNPTQNNLAEFQPVVGIAWSPGKSQKWVIRAGGGIYWDSTPGYYKLREAAAIAPPGASRSTLAASAFTNIYPGIFNFATMTPVPVGSALPLDGLTNMTVGQFDNLVALELPNIEAQLAPPNAQRSGPFSVSGIDLAKQGVEIYPHSFPLARSYQTNIGIQRELPSGIVIQADYARRQGENVSLGEVDENLFNRYEGSATPVPVIPLCKPSQYFVAGQECSTGSITFWNDEGHAIYNGLLLKATKRYSHHTSFVVSYALQRAKDETVWNDVNFQAGYGQYLPHQNLNVAGTYDFKWGFQLSVNSSIITSTPGTALVSGLELPGTVPSGTTEPLPGIPYGSLNAGTDKAQLIAAVNAFNANYAGKLNAQGTPIGALQVPSTFGIGTPIFSQDFRLTKKFTFKEKYTLSLLGELFNAFNVANSIYPDLTLDPKGTAIPAFGQPTQRVGQSLGQGGPRALQLGARFQF